jgi:hypothetical protein
MHELRYVFSLAGLTGARPLPEIYCFIFLTSGFAGLEIALTLPCQELFAQNDCIVFFKIYMYIY